MRTGTRHGLLGWLLWTVALAGCADDDPNALPPTAASNIQFPTALAPAQQPLVLLILDSSGSMERRVGCSCESVSCSECLPDCALSQRSRWLDVLEVLTGSFQRYACSAEPRPREDDSAYDRDYGIPHVQLAADTQQAQDGVLSRFGAQARFAVATLDSTGSYGHDALVGLSSFDWQRSRGALGMYSYAGAAGERTKKARVRPDGSVVGKLFFPGASEPYLIDTGLRSSDAGDGALIVPSMDDAASSTRTTIAQQLRNVRPFGGSPLAAALDDAYFALTHLSARQAAPHTYVVLITDGPADDDFRRLPSPGCDCADEAECGEDPISMSCPYPLPAQAATHLRCGFSNTACDGPVDAVHVIGLSSLESPARAELDAIAAAGGSDAARFAADASELRTRMDELLQGVLRDATR